MLRRFFGFPARSLVTVLTGVCKYLACTRIYIYCICEDQSLVSRAEHTAQQIFWITAGSRMTKDGSYLACDSGVLGTEWSGHIATCAFEIKALFLVTLLLTLIITIQICHR
jgi:hypothetical protein